MADFSDVVKELKQTNSKLDRLADAADPEGPVMAAESEKIREEETRDIKENQLLERIAVAVEKFGPGAGDDKKVGRNLMIFGAIPGIIATMLKGLGIGAIVGAGVYAAFLAFKDGIAGIDWAKELGMEGETGFISGFLGGKKGAKGWMNAAFQGMKGFAMGATAGLPFGPLGVVVGALIGGALFGIAGYFGSEAIAKIIDPIVVKVKNFLGMSVNLTAKEKKAAEAQAIELTAIAKTRREEADIISKKLEAALAAGADQAIIDKLIIAKAKAERLAFTAAKKAREAQEQVLINERQVEKNALNAAEEAVRRNNLEIFKLQEQERKLQSAITMFGKDSKEGRVAAAELSAIRVELRQKREEGKKLREDEVKAEEVLLAEDRKLLKEADEKGISAPWRARMNVFFTDFPKMAKKWFSDYIFDPGADATMGGAGTPMKIFGIPLAMPKILIEWEKDFKQAAPIWFKNNIFDPGKGDVPMRIFGFDLVMPKFAMDAVVGWNKLKTTIPQWIRENIFDPGSAGDDTGAGTPMKIFGMELKFPQLGKLSAKQILDKFPKFFTDPVGYISDLIDDMMSLMPDFLIREKDVSGMSSDEKEAARKNVRTRMSEAEARILKFNEKLGELGPQNKANKGQRDILLGLLSTDQKELGALEKRLSALQGNQMGGKLGPGDLSIVGEGGREIFVSDRAGTILSAGLTRQMLGGMGGGGANIVSAPTVVNAPQSSMTMVGAPIVNDNPILRAVNASALT